MNYKNRLYNMKQKIKDIEMEINDRKNIEKNLSKLEDMLKQPYCHMEIKSLLAKCYIEVGRADEALSLLDFMYECNKSGELLIEIVNLLMNIGKVEEARIYIDKADFSVEKSFIDGVYNKRMGNYDEALNIFNTLKHTVMEDDMYIELAATYSLMGNKEEEKNCYTRLMNTAKKYQALLFLIKNAFGENDPNVENLLKMFDIDRCYHRGDIIKYKRCLLFYKYLKGQLTEDQDSYLGKQLYNYNIDEAINHV